MCKVALFTLKWVTCWVSYLLSQSCVSVSASVCTSLWWKFLEHKSPFIIARMRDWHCLVSVCLYVHVYTDRGRKARGQRSLVLNCWSPIFVCVRERVWHTTRVQMNETKTDSATKRQNDKDRHCICPIIIQSVTCGHSWFKSFGKCPSPVSSHWQHVQDKPQNC